jgi:Spy/CpxP family protein refolding chaperone
MIERLKLTDAQRKSMDDIMMAHRAKLIDLRANLE